jgi:hypothetical protein
VYGQCTLGDFGREGQEPRPLTGAQDYCFHGYYPLAFLAFGLYVRFNPFVSSQADYNWAGNRTLSDCGQVAFRSDPACHWLSRQLRDVLSPSFYAFLKRWMATARKITVLDLTCLLIVI